MRAVSLIRAQEGSLDIIIAIKIFKEIYDFNVDEGLHLFN